MKKIQKMFIVLLLVGFVSMGIGCGPKMVEQFVEIEANETAFLVPLEGASKSGQGKFMSEEFLNEAKVASKRISLPLRKHVTGKLPGSFTWIPTIKVIKVNRAPVTREWTGKAVTGTSSANEALFVESMDSIGFGVGLNVTAMITEEDSARFLYRFAGVSLDTIVDKNVRGFLNSVLSREFAKYDLNVCRTKKNDVIDIATREVKEHFKNNGITIANIGIAEGLVYVNSAIQDKIDEMFTAEMDAQIQVQTNLKAEKARHNEIKLQELANEAQQKANEQKIKNATAEAEAAREFAKALSERTKQIDLEIKKMLAEAKLTQAKNWNGQLPEKILPSNSNLLLQVD